MGAEEGHADADGGHEAALVVLAREHEDGHAEVGGQDQLEADGLGGRCVVRGLGDDAEGRGQDDGDDERREHAREHLGDEEAEAAHGRDGAGEEHGEGDLVSAR